MKHLFSIAIGLFISTCGFKGAAQSPLINFQLLGEVPVTIPATPQAIVVDALDKPYCYLAAKADGLRIYQIQNASDITLAKTIPITQFGNLEVMNVCQRGNLLYLALGNFFGESNLQAPGLAIVDVSNPLNPLVSDVWTWSVQDQGSFYVAVDGNYAYLGAMRQGLILLNIADPTHIQFVSQIIPDRNFPLPNPSTSQMPRARGLAIRDDKVYLCYDAGGLRVISVSDKAHPIEIGHYINAAPFVPANKQQAFNNIILDGNLAYVAVDYCGLEVLNIEDPTQVSSVSWWNPWDCNSLSNLWVGSPGHTNQMAFDTTHKFVFLASGQSELSVVDVSNPDQPIFAGGYGDTNNNLGTWGMTLHGDRVFLAYIIAVLPFASNWAGIKVLAWQASSTTVDPAYWEAQALTPNPFEKEFTFQFELKKDLELHLELVNGLGQPVAKWAPRLFLTGRNEISWQGDIPAGLYVLHASSKLGDLNVKIIKH